METERAALGTERAELRAEVERLKDDLEALEEERSSHETTITTLNEKINLLNVDKEKVSQLMLVIYMHFSNHFLYLYVLLNAILFLSPFRLVQF